MVYNELRKGLQYFRLVFQKRLLPANAIAKDTKFLQDIVAKPDWSMSEAMRVLNIMKPYGNLIKKVGFDIATIPAIKDMKQIQKPAYKLPKQKLIGYDNDAFVVYFPWNESLVQQIRMIKGARWKKEKRYWNVPLAQIDQLRTFGQKNEFKYTEKGRAMFNNINDNFEASYKAEAVELNLPMKLQPYNFQSSGIDYGMKNQRIILGDEMGLGKTPQGIGIVLGLDAFPCLVICPKSLRLNWQKEIHRFTHKKAIIISPKNIRSLKSYVETNMAHFFITNFEGINTHFVKEIKTSLITKGPNQGNEMTRVFTHGYEGIFKSGIIDEAHECRNHKTRRFKTLKPVLKNMKVKLALTGSPIVKGTADLAALLELIGRIDDFGGNYRFVRNYNRLNSDSVKTQKGKPMPDNLKELNIKLRSICFIRREKYQVLKELPDKIRQIISIEIDNMQEYNQAVNMFRMWMQEKNYTPEKIDRAMRAELLVKIGTLKQLSAKGKLSAFKEFVSDVVDSGEKLVIFCWYKNTANFIKDNFDDVLLITGDVTDDEVEENKRKFQEEEKYKLIVVTYKRGGVGHTLTAASKVAMIELGWTYKDQSQAEDRLHRIGQENAVNCYYFLGQNTIDEDIYEIIESRRIMEKEATGGSTEIKTSFYKDLTKKLLSDETTEDAL